MLSGNSGRPVANQWELLVKNRRLFRYPALAALCAGLLGLSGAAQTASHPPQAPAPAQSPAASQPAATQQDLDQLRQSVDDQNRRQRQRLDQLEQQNQELTRQLQAAEQQLSQAEQKIDRIGADTPQISGLESAVASLKSAQTAATATIEQLKQAEPQPGTPTALHYRGVTLVPGGYFAGEALYRSHAENADINTTWSSIPWDAQTMSHLSEFRATARATRLSLRGSGLAGRATVSGYFETDFLASGTGANENQTNGYSPRVRQMWGRVQFPGGWSFAGGQMWSLLTMNRTGIDNLTEYAPALIDSTVLPGFDYARQTAFRVTRQLPAYKTVIAFSAENAATVGVTPANVPASVSGIISGLATTGTGIMANTTYSTNVAPDLISKVAFDPKFGHFEVKAIGRTFRDRLDTTATVPGKNNTLLGGAFGGSAYLPVFTPKISYLAAGMYGASGRYGASGTDVIVKPNGVLSAEKSIHGITGFEFHPGSRLDVYAYGADEYLPRDWGYGLKTINNKACFAELAFSCLASTKALEAAAGGFWYRFYKGPAGTVQYGANYVYVLREAWSGVGGAPRGIDNIVESSFRYYLP
jgi:multidrug efflux pump subunit AcrA (membrane-fusion protein)